MKKIAYAIIITLLCFSLVEAKMNQKGMTCDTTRRQILGADAKRSAYGIKSISTNTITIYIGDVNVTADTGNATSGIPISASDSFTMNNSPVSTESSDAIYCVTATGSALISVIYTTRK